MKRTLSILPLLLAGILLKAQIVTDMNQGQNGTGVITTTEQNALTGDEYAAGGIIDDWNKILEEFESFQDTEPKIPNEGTKETLTQKINTLLGQELFIPYIPDEEGANLFFLTSDGITLFMDLDDTAYYQETDDEIIRWVRFYAYRKKEWTKKVFKRYESWEPVIKEYFLSAGVPPEMAELCLIESGCTYTALSHAGALGMWQIMPETGRQYGLKINQYVDERKDPILSTQAAAKILSDNYKRVGDWTLAAAAYNCGSGKVLSKGKKGSHWNTIKDLLPKETRQYIPSLIAIHYLWKNRNELKL